MKRFTLALAALVMLGGFVFAEPPNFNPPAILAPVGEYAYFVPDETVKSAIYIGLDGYEAFPIELIGGKPGVFFFPVRGLRDGAYRFVGVASSKDGEQVRRPFSVVVGKPDGKEPDKKEPDKKEPDPKLPPAPTSYFFAIIRAEPAPPGFSEYIDHDSWNILQSKGHRKKDYTVRQAAALNIILDPGTQIPCVVTLRTEKNADGKIVSKVQRKAIPLPADPLNLLDGLPK